MDDIFYISTFISINVPELNTLMIIDYVKIIIPLKNQENIILIIYFFLILIRYEEI